MSVCWCVALAGTVEHAQIIVAIPERNDVFYVEFRAEVVNRVTLASQTVVDVDPVQRRFSGSLLTRLSFMDGDTGVGNEVILIGDAGVNSLHGLGAPRERR